MKHGIIKDPHTYNRIHQHLTNKNDVISEEDIMNAKTDLSVNSNPGIRTGSRSYNTISVSDNQTEEYPNTLKDEPGDAGIETPWNILK